ncbi:MAG: response regulator [Gemmatimonadota bacterium]
MVDANASGERWSRARILILDDEPANREFLRHVLQPEGYGQLLEMSDGRDALDRLDELCPDIILLDLMMPEFDGFAFMDALRGRPGVKNLPIVALTADPTAAIRRRALASGASDFMARPLSHADVRLRVRNLLATRFLHEELRDYTALLEERVTERTRELEQARIEILERLARAAEFRDDDTGQHTVRVGRVAARLAQMLKLEPDEVELIRRAAPLHDIGKIGVPDAILLKEGRLTPEEQAVMRTHTKIGARILSGSRSPLLQLAERIAMTHHEHWDGDGYPDALSGEAIPLEGRIVAVADVFDSLTHERPYKVAWTARDTLAYIEDHAGAQFDAVVVEALLRIAPEIRVLESGLLVDATSTSQIAVPEPALEEPAESESALLARVRALTARHDELTRELERLRTRLEQGPIEATSGTVAPLDLNAAVETART